VSVAQKLKWKKLINQLRYVYEELELVKEIATSTAGEFQTYYEDFCNRNNIDLDELNRKHAAEIEKLYGSPKPESDDIGQLPYSGSTDLALYEGEEQENVEAQHVSTEEEDADDREMYEIFSKLFKKIALALHPDRVNSKDLSDEEKEEMLKMFKKAKEALEEEWYFVLLDCAEKYNIPLPKNYKQQLGWMRKELKSALERVGKETTTYNYRFADCESDECRDNLIRGFLNQVFQINV
tara:strand:+ start:360 stop:1073 length:714 start_codon:yes stop_codon:yes gene_type:complete